MMRAHALGIVFCAVMMVAALLPSQRATAQSPLPNADVQGGATSLAQLLLSAGRYRDALNEFERLHAADTSAAIAWLGMGRAQEALGRPRDAAQSYVAYTTRAPEDASGFELLGRTLGNLGRHADALAAYRKAQRLDATSAAATLGAARALRTLDRREEALWLLRESARARPENADVWGELATVSLELERDVEAASYWDEALRRDPAYFDDRAGERSRWERVMGTLGGAPPRADIAVSFGNASPLPARDSGATVRARPDSNAVVVASPFYPRFVGAARTSAFVPGPSSSGTGFVVERRAGYVLTNKHVVRSCRQVKVRVDGGKSRVATIQALDPDDDLALLRVSLPAGPSAAFRDDPAIRPGDDVVAVGFPLAGLLADQVNVSTGTVNALAGLYNDLHMLQMSTPVQPGSSGGALFDASGNVVGVVVTKLNARVVAEETGDIPQNVNFAVKAEVAREFLKQQGVAFRTAQSSRQQSNADVGDIGRQVTLLVECWP